MSHRFVAIEGAIGVGKTTLARHLSAAQAQGGEVLLEVFEENPFLSAFYADRERYAFQTQIFFLLSRYRQQTHQLPHWLVDRSVVSDYLFDKDWIFAHLNLEGDEVTIYENLHGALKERLPTPDLVVYLRADTEVLMQRIAMRDRPYERSMDRAYIHALATAYDTYFTNYQDAPLLVIDTNERDFVRHETDRHWITGVVRSALDNQAVQPSLPDMEATLSSGGVPILAGGRRRLGDFQRFHRALDREKGFINDLFLNFICLTEEVGEIGKDLKRIWIRRALLAEQLHSESAAYQQALSENIDPLKAELADALAFLLKIANDLGIDLEQSYVSKMERNWDRTWER
ncbi:MAG: deoxynucleoside kinase [Caldilineaceae bacterium]|nr:deoxynucleoside kinase [Caldilineaceae bacterium]MBP8124961.1 deoxynucleoside kinase [Caldilineaceae bacterium]MBP9074857.1 deoxynucleoside kinase [Caldilineaceae bacterium]